MAQGPHPDAGYGYQGQHPSAPGPWGAQYPVMNDHQNRNDMPYARDGGAPFRQQPKPSYPRDPRHAQEHPWQYHGQDSALPQSPELQPSHSSGSVRTDRFDAEVQREKKDHEDAMDRLKERYDNKINELSETHEDETEQIRNGHEKTVADLHEEHEKTVTELHEEHEKIARELTREGADLRLRAWILEVDLFGKTEATNSNLYNETYRRLTEEFTSLGLAFEGPEDSGQPKSSCPRTMPPIQKKLLSLHVSYVQKQMDHYDNILVKEVDVISKMIQTWGDIESLEWRQAYSLWCSALLKQRDPSVEYRMRYIWPQDQTEGESSDVRLWRFQIGDELCKFLSNSHAENAEASLALRKRMLREKEAQKELTDPTLRTRLNEDTVRTGLSLALAYLDHLKLLPTSNPDKQKSFRRESMEKLEEIWNKNIEQRNEFTPTILTVGQNLGCLLYTDFREEKADKAKEVLESVWAARKANLPQNLEDTLLTGHHLFLMYTYLQNYPEAKSVFEEVWKTVQLMPTSKLDKNLKFYHSLTDFLRQSLNTEPGYGVTLEILGKSNDVDELKLCVDIGIIFFRDKRYAEAEAILRQAYNAYKTSSPPDLRGNKDALACGQCLAHAIAEQSRYSEAMAIFEEVLLEHKCEVPGAQHADDQESHRYIRVLMRHLNHEITSRPLTPKLLQWYLQAVKICPQFLQKVFQAPEMHNCARRLLLDLVKSSQYDAANSLLGLLKYPDVVSRDILPFSFRYELCRCVMKQGNLKMADKLLRELLESSDWGREELQAQEVIIELGSWLLEESKIEDAMHVFENATVVLSKASHKIDERRQIAIRREQEIPTFILTPEDETAKEFVLSKKEAAPKRKETASPKPTPKLRPPATTKAILTRGERGSLDSQRWGANTVDSEAASDRSTSPKHRSHRPRASSDQSSRRKNERSPRRRSDPRVVEKRKGWGGLGLF